MSNQQEWPWSQLEGYSTLWAVYTSQQEAKGADNVNDPRSYYEEYEQQFQ